MKFPLTCLSFLLFGSLVFAQKSAYLKAEVGLGKTTTRENNTFGIDWKPTGAFRGALSGGVSGKHLNLEIGFGYSQSGGRIENVMISDGLNQPYGFIGTLTILNHHFTLPVSLGYRVPLGKRWSVQPRLGLEATYNSGVTNRHPNGTRQIEKDTYHQYHNKYSLFGSGALQLHYRVSPSIELFGGPSYRYGLTNLGKNPDGPANKVQHRTAIGTVDGGLLFYLRKEQKSSTPAFPPAPPQE